MITVDAFDAQGNLLETFTPSPLFLMTWEEGLRTWVPFMPPGGRLEIYDVEGA